MFEQHRNRIRRAVYPSRACTDAMKFSLAVAVESAASLYGGSLPVACFMRVIAAFNCLLNSARVSVKCAEKKMETA